MATAVLPLSAALWIAGCCPCHSVPHPAWRFLAAISFCSAFCFCRVSLTSLVLCFSSCSCCSTSALSLSAICQHVHINPLHAAGSMCTAQSKISVRRVPQVLHAVASTDLCSPSCSRRLVMDAIVSSRARSVSSSACCRC